MTLLSLVIILSGCSIVTKYHYYSIEYEPSLNKDFKELIWVDFVGTEKPLKKPTLLSEEIIETNPYYFNLVVNGDFDKIKDVNVSILINQKEKVSYKISDQDANQLVRKVEVNLKQFEFKKRTLKLEQNNLERIELKVSFLGIKGNIIKPFNDKIILIPRKTFEKGNRLFDAIMSV